MIVRRFNASVWHGGSRAARYGNRSSTVNGLGMRRVRVQGRHQRRARPDQADPRVAMTVDPTLVALRQAKPTLQIEIIPDRFVLLLADEQAGQEAEHHRRHAVADRILGRLELIDQRLELLFGRDLRKSNRRSLDPLH